eukprot:5985901-Ditylum_brightwellii.AAC.1
MNKNGKHVLYLRLQNALYGCLKIALLFYKRLVEDLEAYGFKLNKYDKYVANNVVNGKQLTMI